MKVLNLDKFNESLDLIGTWNHKVSDSSAKAIFHFQRNENRKSILNSIWPGCCRVRVSSQSILSCMCAGLPGGGDTHTNSTFFFSFAFACPHLPTKCIYRILIGPFKCACLKNLQSRHGTRQRKKLNMDKSLKRFPSSSFFISLLRSARRCEHSHCQCQRNGVYAMAPMRRWSTSLPLWTHHANHQPSMLETRCDWTTRSTSDR